MDIENEVSTDLDVGTALPGGAPPIESPAPEVPERKSVRENLKDGFARARERMGLEDDTEAQPEKPKPAKRARAEKANAQDPDPGVQTPVQSQTATQPPAAWAKDAKEVWESVPPAAQAAIAKREQDVEKGVLALRDHYQAIDSAIAPHVATIQQMGKTPGEAIQHLFGWFQALAGNPVDAIPALMMSFQYPPEVVVAIGQKLGLQVPNQGQPQEGQEQQPQHQVPPELIQYIQQQQERIQQLEQAFQGEIGGIKNTFQQQSMAQTQSFLQEWAKDKPYFNEVREFMGRLLTPDPQTGIAAVPLKDGQVDLETAYDMAVHAIPSVRARALAEKQAAAAQAQQAKAKAEASAQNRAATDAARKRVTVSSVAPGGEVNRNAPKKGSSVRESLMAAMQEHSGRT